MLRRMSSSSVMFSHGASRVKDHNIVKIDWRDHSNRMKSKDDMLR